MEIKKIFLAIALLSSVVAVNAMENTHNGVSYKLTGYNKAEYEMLKKRLNSAPSQAKAKAQEDLNNFFEGLVGRVPAQGQEVVQPAIVAAVQAPEAQVAPIVTPHVEEEENQNQIDHHNAALALANRPVEQGQLVDQPAQDALDWNSQFVRNYMKQHNNRRAAQKRRIMQVGSFIAPLGLAVGGYLGSSEIQNPFVQVALGAGAAAVGGALRSQCDTNRVKTRRALTTVAAVAGAAGFVSTVGNFVLGLVGDSTPARAAITLSTSVVASLYAAKKLVDHYDSQVTPVVVLAQAPFEVIDAAEAADAENADDGVTE